MVSDPGITVTGGPIPVLEVGQIDSTTFEGTYSLTQADIDVGSFSNTAIVTSDEGVEDTDTWIEPLLQVPEVPDIEARDE